MRLPSVKSSCFFALLAAVLLSSACLGDETTNNYVTGDDWHVVNDDNGQFFCDVEPDLESRI